MAVKILVVDDDLDTLRLVGMMLERQGFTILAASSGQQAINLAHGENPELVRRIKSGHQWGCNDWDYHGNCSPAHEDSDISDESVRKPKVLTQPKNMYRKL
jgi:CheY-like chemotaxis protein